MSVAVNRDLKSSYAIDAARVFYHKPTDPAYPHDETALDSVWVAVVGPTPEAVTAVGARSDVTRYVAQTLGPCEGYDQEEPPVPDDGKRMPLAITAASNPNARLTMSEEEYHRASARRSMAPAKDHKYVAYYRVRRLSIL